MFYSENSAFWSALPSWEHIYSVANVGNVFPKAGVTPQIQDGFELSQSGELARLHSNGDLFLCDGDRWLRVNADTVDFVGRSR